MNEIERIDRLREELHQHNYNYYVLNAPVISDREFDMLMKELQDLESKHPEHFDENSPVCAWAATSTKTLRRYSTSIRCFH